MVRTEDRTSSAGRSRVCPTGSLHIARADRLITGALARRLSRIARVDRRL